MAWLDDQTEIFLQKKEKADKIVKGAWTSPFALLDLYDVAKSERKRKKKEEKEKKRQQLKLEEKEEEKKLALGWLSSKAD